MFGFHDPVKVLTASRLPSGDHAMSAMPEPTTTSAGRSISSPCTPSNSYTRAVRGGHSHPSPPTEPLIINAVTSFGPGPKAGQLHPTSQRIVATGACPAQARV